MTATLNGVKNVYETDIFKQIIEKIEKELDVKYNEDTGKHIRIIADHCRAITVMISDGAFPSNIDQ
ncbi:MAG: hypothetical protein LBQ24_06930 [Candidatus Peribacteria bacterium]|nr:hypothetical protein [Candidatus Peribacteria bacterium]